MCGTVKARKRDLDGNPIGCQSDNPILDTQLYDVKFPNGEVTPLTANAIAQAMYAQCDVDGNEYLLLKCFVDVQKDHTAISLDDQRAVHNGCEYMHCTTLGWHICCQWKDSADQCSHSWSCSQSGSCSCGLMITGFIFMMTSTGVKLVSLPPFLA